jgi:hypothetical protein
MTWIDDVRKWFLAPKTLKGIAGMIVIIIVLALDFAYWAGAIKVTDLASGEEEVVVEVNETIKYEVEHFEEESTLLIPGGGIVNNDFTSDSYPFTVNENASNATIKTTHTGNNPKPDVDLALFGPDGQEIPHTNGPDAEEKAELDDKDFERYGYGDYTVEVRNYSSFRVQYKITIDVYNPILNTTSEEGE